MTKKKGLRGSNGSVHMGAGIYITKVLHKMLQRDPDCEHSKLLRKEIEKLKEEQLKKGEKN